MRLLRIIQIQVILLLAGGFVTAQHQEPQSRKQSLENARDYFLIATSAQQRGDFLLSISFFDSAIIYHPQYVDAIFSQASSFEQLGEFSKALFNYERTLDLKPGFEGALFRKAVCLYHLKQWPEAKRNLDILIANNGSAGETQAVFYRYSPSGDLIISTDSQVGPEYFSYRALVNLELLRAEEGLADADSAVILSNYAPNYLVNRGKMLQKLGRIGEATSDYEMALKKDPENQTALVNLFTIAPAKARKRYEENEAVMAGVILPELLAQLASQEYSEGHYMEAIVKYSKAIEAAPKNTDWIINRALCYSKRGEYSAAEEDLQRAISLSEFPSKAYLHLANIYFMQDAFDQALTYYNLFIAMEPDYGLAYYNRGLSHDRLGDLAHACSDLQRAFEMGVQVSGKPLEAICSK